eukprot:3489425-Prymnesium_polylepis.1
MEAGWNAQRLIRWTCQYDVCVCVPGSTGRGTRTGHACVCVCHAPNPGAVPSHLTWGRCRVSGGNLT